MEQNDIMQARKERILAYIRSEAYIPMKRRDLRVMMDVPKEDLPLFEELLQQLIDEHIIKAAETGEPVAIAFEQFEGDPIKVAVTGSLPPMDYVAPDGSFAGFNTAVLSEIGKRLQKNIELVQVDSVGRALALAEGTVDVVFWTRVGSPDPSQYDVNMDSEEIKTIYDSIIEQTATLRDPSMDVPDGTILTVPYLHEMLILVFPAK